MNNTADQSSDIDLYVYTQAGIPLETRQSIVTASGGASKMDLAMTYWGSGDEWFHASTGIEVDIVYFDAMWIVNQIHKVINGHEASLGYTTCLWHTIRNSEVLFDPQNWFANLQQNAAADYPEDLQKKIIFFNHPVLRGVIPSYANQLAKAVRRHDQVSVNHRLAALLASYFDIIFAVNRELHPGEKRLIQFALARCRKLPENFANDIASVISASNTKDQVFLANVTILLDHLDQWLAREGFLPSK
jgi:hypothetical protein